jgi:hypothetical protein
MDLNRPPNNPFVCVAGGFADKKRAQKNALG